jgi:hypothetical protein
VTAGRIGADHNQRSHAVGAHVAEVSGLAALMTYLKTTLALLCEHFGSIIEKVPNDETYP